MGRALEMMHTGRPVGADEALRFGLANRVVPSGRALTTAIGVARDISSFPQATLRADRSAALEGWGLPMDEALEIERQRVLAVFATAVEGAGRFASGEGRHGSGVEPRC